MSETWKQWEGQVVNGEFPLLRYLGGSRHSAVFLTGRKTGDPQKAAIKLILADPSSAENQLKRWQQAAQLNHPNLVRVFEFGRCEIESTLLLYVVMEAAEEDLSQILPERALTAGEERQMLPSVLDALAYLHGKGMVHGRLRPSNILAAGDQVKVSADTLRPSGERVVSPDGWGGYDPPESSSGRLTPASDVWSLAITIVQTLTQQRPLWHPAEPAAPSLPENTPAPFAETARHCLQVDPQQRWTVAEITARLADAPSKPAAAGSRSQRTAAENNGKTKPPKRSYASALIAAVAVSAVIALVVLVGNRHSSSSLPASPVEGDSQRATPASAALPETQSPPAENKPSAVVGSKKSTSHGSADKPVTSAAGKGTVLERVMPRVSPSARRTIEGRIKVAVRVDVDPSGKVTEAKLVSPGPSQYFARLALEAAREWKFSPAQVQGQAVASQWNLRFGFRRSGTDVDAKPIAP
ncbi:MAG: TonB family protein [Acidobacteria bacterium]|nr:TonB family protein [Acidobacteriota bacterium]